MESAIRKLLNNAGSEMRIRMTIPNSRGQVKAVVTLDSEEGRENSNHICGGSEDYCPTSSFVTELKPMMTLGIRDLDSVTEKEDMEIALRTLLDNSGGEMRISMTTPDSREQVRAFVTLDAESGLQKSRMHGTRRLYMSSGCLSGHRISECANPAKCCLCVRFISN